MSWGRCERKWSNGKLKKNKNGTRITAWAALPAVWQTNKQTKQRQQRHCYVLFIWIWRCDTTNSGHIGIREFRDLCQEFGIEEVVRGDIYCYYPFISIDIEQVIGNDELACMNKNLNTWTEATFTCSSFANIFRLMDFPYCKSLPFFYFLTFEKGRLPYIHPVGWSVGRLVDVNI